MEAHSLKLLASTKWVDQTSPSPRPLQLHLTGRGGGVVGALLGVVRKKKTGPPQGFTFGEARVLIGSQSAWRSWGASDGEAMRRDPPWLTHGGYGDVNGGIGETGASWRADLPQISSAEVILRRAPLILPFPELTNAVSLGARLVHFHASPPRWPATLILSLSLSRSTVSYPGVEHGTVARGR